MIKTFLMLLFVSLPLTSLCGCSQLAFKDRDGKCDLQLVSRSDSAIKVCSLNVDAKTTVYRSRTSNSVTMIISDMALDDLRSGHFTTGQVICIDILWQPTAGSTPMDPTTTNCSIRDVIFSEDAVGVYGGAGFLSPNSKTGQASFSGNIDNSNMKLIYATQNFFDQIGLAQLQGSFTVIRDDEAVRNIAVQLNSAVSNSMGKMCLVVSD